MERIVDGITSIKAGILLKTWSFFRLRLKNTDKYDLPEFVLTFYRVEVYCKVVNKNNNTII